MSSMYPSTYVYFKGRSNITFFAFLIGIKSSSNIISVGISSLGLKNFFGFHEQSSIRFDAKSTIVSNIRHHLLGPEDIPKQSLVNR